MSSIVKVKNPKTGITYVYESESYWDKELKQPRNHRKLIGKLNEKGEVVPTGKKGRPRTARTDGIPDGKAAEQMRKEVENYAGRCRELEAENDRLRGEISHLRAERKETREYLEKLAGRLGD